MKLLPKKTEVNASKAAERKAEIDEGKKLAETIDVLRKTRATEAASLEKFRTETLRTIKLEIVSLGTQKESLAEQVRNLASELEEKKSSLKKLLEQVSNIK